MFCLTSFDLIKITRSPNVYNESTGGQINVSMVLSGITHFKGKSKNRISRKLFYPKITTLHSQSRRCISKVLQIHREGNENMKLPTSWCQNNNSKHEVGSIPEKQRSTIMNL